MRNDMEYKLKHLSKFCCKPANPLEFEAVKMAAEIGGVELDEFEWPNLDDDIFTHAWVDNESGILSWARKEDETVLNCIDFIKKLRMSEEEARELEDDRVYIAKHSNLGLVLGSDNLIRKIIAHDGYKWQTNEDGTEATLHKRKSC